MKREARKKIINGETFPESSSIEIARRAYEIWLSEGCPHGCDQEHWLRAERELVGETRRAVT